MSNVPDEPACQDISKTRTYIAAKAMEGMLADPNGLPIGDQISRAKLADLAVAMADALIDALKK